MSSTPLRCQCRRQAPTHLRCARCDVPICPDCSVSTPTGMICRECGSPKRHALFQVSAGSLALAVLVSLAVAVLGGWLLISVGLGFGFFALWGALLYGGAVAEVALRVTGRKRGTAMEVVAGVCAALGLLVGWFLAASSRGAGLAFAVPHSPRLYLVAILGVAAAISRIRYV